MIDARVLIAKGKAALQFAGPTIGSAPAQLARLLARGAVPLSWTAVGFVTVGAVAATAAYLPMHQGRSAGTSAGAKTPAVQARASNFAERWHDDWVQVAGRIGMPVQRKRDDSWLWAATSPYATRFARNNIAAASVATPLPLPRPDGIAQQAVAAPAVANEPRVASLPPQQQEPQARPSEPGLLDKLFGDPDQAAKAVLAAHPNTVLYDITKRAVYMPDGTRLEAHSGFGEWMDDPDSVHRKNVGVTPPNVYAVSFREKPFHGVRALRMKPVGDGKMYGRDGILAHSFLLGEAGASNGCISIREYDKFLQAYEAGQFTQIIVMRSIDEPVPRLIASAQ